MKVVIVSKTSFNSVQYTGVTNIAYSGNIVTITLSGGQTAAYNLDDYSVGILW